MKSLQWKYRDLIINSLIQEELYHKDRLTAQLFYEMIKNILNIHKPNYLNELQHKIIPYLTLKIIRISAVRLLPTHVRTRAHKLYQHRMVINALGGAAFSVVCDPYFFPLQLNSNLERGNSFI